MRPRLEAERIQQLISALLATNSRVMSDQNRLEWLAGLDRAASHRGARPRAPKATARFLRDMFGAAGRAAAGHPPIARKGGEQ